MKGLNIVEGPSVGATHYRVFHVDMTYFEVQDGQLKLTSSLKKGSSTFGRLRNLSFVNLFSNELKK